MHIPYMKPSTTAPLLKSDLAIKIRAHRDRAVHRNIIAAYRKAHPLCERCQAGGHTRGTHQIHHIVQVSERGATTPSNLLALCKQCHDSIHDIPAAIQRTFKQDRTHGTHRPESHP